MMTNSNKYNNIFEETGWIKLHRKIISSRVFVNPDLLKLWILCLVKANHKENWVDMDGLTEPIKVNPGQFITGRYSLHKEYYPKKIKDMKSPLTLWRWLLKLEKWGNLNIKTNNKYSVVSICNWDTYQSVNFENEQQNEHQVNNSRTSGEHQVNTNKNDIRMNKKLNISFEKFWNLYDKKVDRKKSEIAWSKLSNKERLEIMNFLPRYKRVKPDKTYRKNPMTFFNNRTWEDELFIETPDNNNLQRANAEAYTEWK